MANEVLECSFDIAECPVQIPLGLTGLKLSAWGGGGKPNTCLMARKLQRSAMGFWRVGRWGNLPIAAYAGRDETADGRAGTD